MIKIELKRKQLKDNQEKLSATRITSSTFFLVLGINYETVWYYWDKGIERSTVNSINIDKLLEIELSLIFQNL